MKKVYKYTARHGLTCYELKNEDLKSKDYPNYVWVWESTSTKITPAQRRYDSISTQIGQTLIGYYDTPEKAILASLKKYYELQLNVRSKITTARKTLNEVMNKDKKIV